MNLRTLIPLTFLLGILSLFPVGGFLLSAHSGIPSLASEQTDFMVVAKKTQRSSRSSSPITVNNVRYHAHKKYTRVVLDLPAQAVLRESKNDKNHSVSITLAKSRLSARALKKIQNPKFPKAINISEGTSQTVVLTLDLTLLTKYALQTLQQPNRVVLDLYYSRNTRVVTSNNLTPPPAARKTTDSTPDPVIEKSQPLNPNVSDETASRPPSLPANLAKNFKDLVVVIDPGHGGKDPGATGKKGTQEKHITLKIGMYLKDLIQKRLGSTVLMTRETDIFLDLEERVVFANKKKADIFISIHLNSHPQRSVKGLEIYHFGKASDPRALEVAARENGMKLEDDAPPWQFIIADKLNDQKIEQSQTFAWTTNKTLVKTLKASYKVKDHGVKTAPFYVLRFTTMPSILAEVAFVSNPEEENRLRSQAFQKKLAEGMYQAVQSYLKTAFPTLS
jgi:N-acetylmuramoyl-L-alanine amidase